MVRKRKKPRVRRGRPWVRFRFDAVEMPLNRTRKSMKARNKSFGPVFAIVNYPLRAKFPTTIVGDATEVPGCRIILKEPWNRLPTVGY